MWMCLLALTQTPPAPPGASWVLVERVHAPFTAMGASTEFTAVRRQSISSVFSTYTGIAVADILTSTTDVEEGVSILVDHAVPQGTTGTSVASALNNGVMRSVDILQSALQNTGGTIVVSVSSVSLVSEYEVVYPPPGPGPPLSETLIIVIAVGGVLALVALIGIARYCNADMLRETTTLILGIVGTVTGRGGGSGGGENDANKEPVTVVLKTPDAVKTPPPPDTSVAPATLTETVMAKGKQALRALVTDQAPISREREDAKRSVRTGVRPVEHKSDTDARSASTMLTSAIVNNGRDAPRAPATDGERVPKRPVGMQTVAMAATDVGGQQQQKSVASRDGVLDDGGVIGVKRAVRMGARPATTNGT